MSSRVGKKERWLMANNNTVWVDVVTRKNIDMIYDYLLLVKREAEKDDKPVRSKSYADISKATGINPKQVSYACKLMAFKKTPYFQIKADKILTKKSVRVTEKVLLRRVHQSDA